jgi:hypothetical protein
MRKLPGFAFILLVAATFTAATLPYTTSVVAKKSFLNQVGPIPTTTLYIPKKGGDFRVSIYLTSPNIGPENGRNNPAIFVTPSWTDSSGKWPSQYFGVNGIYGLFYGSQDQSLPAAAGGSAVIHVKENTPIQVEDDGSSDLVDTYSVFVTVEKL